MGQALIESQDGHLGALQLQRHVRLVDLAVHGLENLLQLHFLQDILGLYSQLGALQN